MRKEKYIKVKKYKSSTYYTVQFTYNVNGKSETYSKTFQSMREAIEHRDLKRAELITTGLPRRSLRTCRQVLDDYHRINHVCKGTVKRHEGLFKHFKELHDIPVAKLTPLDLQRSFSSLIYDLSDDSLSKARSVWKHIFDTAILEDIITVSPLSKVVIPKSKYVKKERHEAICDDETFFAVIDYLRQNPGESESERYNTDLMISAMMIHFYTGMRPAEVVALHRDEVDFGKHLIHIRYMMGSDEVDTNIRTKTKTDFSRRDIPMSTECEMILRKVCSQHEDDHLFLNYQGRAMTVSYIGTRLWKTEQVTGLHVNLYQLRHRASTKMIIEGNVDPRTAMEVLGHSNISTTLKFYTHSNQKAKSEATEKLVENSRKLS